MFGQGMGGEMGGNPMMQNPERMRKLMMMMQGGGAENPFMQWWRARGMQNAPTLPINNIRSLLGQYSGGGGGGSLPAGAGMPAGGLRLPAGAGMPAGGLRLPAGMAMTRRTPTGG